MVLSDFGKIVDAEWKKSFEIRNELFVDEYIVMPNHLHAIVIIDKTNINDGSHVVETHGRAFLQSTDTIQSSEPSFYRKPQSLSSFIAGFKSAVNSNIDDFIDENNLNITKYNRNNHFFQPNYYDHIIRNKNEYNRITQYIIDNPIKWGKDKLNNGSGNIVMEPNVVYDDKLWMI